MMAFLGAALFFQVFQGLHGSEAGGGGGPAEAKNIGDHVGGDVFVGGMFLWNSGEQEMQDGLHPFGQLLDQTGPLADFQHSRP